MFDLKLNEEGIKPVPASEEELEAMAALAPGRLRDLLARC